MKTLRINDFIKVVDSGQTYSTSTEMRDQLKLKNWCEHYTPPNGVMGIIIGMAKNRYGDRIFAVRFEKEHLLAFDHAADRYSTRKKYGYLLTHENQYVDVIIEPHGVEISPVQLPDELFNINI